VQHPQHRPAACPAAWPGSQQAAGSKVECSCRRFALRHSLSRSEDVRDFCRSADSDRKLNYLLSGDCSYHSCGDKFREWTTRPKMELLPSRRDDRRLTRPALLRAISANSASLRYP
jgi:hypothetical protein